MIDLALIDPDRIRPLRRAEYEQLVELGFFEDERIELLGGLLVRYPRLSPAHAHAATTLNEVFLGAIADRAAVHVRSPLAVSEDSEPEPDLAIVPSGDYRHAHPTTALLVVEVVEPSRRTDAVIKAGIYARAAIPECWLVDLHAGHVEVRKVPAGGEYLQIATYSTGIIAPAAFPDIEVSVPDLLAQ